MNATKQWRGNVLAVCRWAGLVSLSLAWGIAQSQGKTEERPGGYPKRPIRVLVGAPAGSGSDLTMRTVSQSLGERLGQTVVVDNRPGAAGAISVQLTAQATPDGHTLTMGTTSTHVIAPAAYAKVNYDPLKDFVPITLVASTPYLLVVHPGVQAKSLKEFIALARSQPGGCRSTRSVSG